MSPAGESQAPAGARPALLHGGPRPLKLVHALLKLGRLPDFDLRDHLDLAALGTVADMVPLRGDNRIMVSKGLLKIGAGHRTGLRALKAVAGLDGHVDTHHIGFRLGPRLNASGRLDHAQASLDLMLSNDKAECDACAALLDGLNKERQEVELLAQTGGASHAGGHGSQPWLKGTCIVLRLPCGWHPGVVGIVASRIMRDHHRPALIIAIDQNGVGRGSGRSVPGISLVEAINECRGLLLEEAAVTPWPVGVSRGGEESLCAGQRDAPCCGAA